MQAGSAGLRIEDLVVSIGGNSVVQRVSLAVADRSVHCLVGESGSGKTLTSLAAIGLLPPGAVATGSVRVAGVAEDLLTIDQQRWSTLRGATIGYVGQNALGCLHPAYRVGTQLVETIRRHQSLPTSDARALALEELRAVDLPEAERVADAYPAQLSGGMCQRVALAIALCNRPSILIADEPTTALDDDTQGHILDLIHSRVGRDGLSVLLITHDQRVVEHMADEVTRIADGMSTPAATADAGSEIEVKGRPATTAKPTPVPAAEANNRPPALEIVGVAKAYGRARRFGRSKRPVPVIENVNIAAEAGATIGLVGRSGAGKTTLAQIVAGVLEPSAGAVRIAGRPVTGPNRVDRVEKAGLVQYVFQNPFGSLNPRRSALAQVAEPLIVAGASDGSAREKARELLADVGLTPAQIDRRPTALSGGQCQRVGIARALIRKPQVVVLDEPVSALDWSIRAEILAILADLQNTTGATYLLISHEQSLIEQQSDRVYAVADGAILSL